MTKPSSPHLFGLKGAAAKAKLARYEPIFCVGLLFPCAMVAEMLSRENVDVLILDMEHGPWDTAGVRQLLMATADSPAAVVARPGTLDQAQIQLLFDLGIDGLMVGHCDDLAVTRRAIALSKYAPLGRRGVGPSRAGARSAAGSRRTAIGDGDLRQLKDDIPRMANNLVSDAEQG